MNHEQCWQSVVARDPAADGEFFVAVKTTGVYCRPSCKSRMPKRENVTFFKLPVQAEDAGFRPCKRCRPREVALTDPRAVMVESVCAYIHAHMDDTDRLALSEIGAAVGYEAGYVASVFKSVMGMTPRQYIDAQRMDNFKTLLRDGVRVSDAVYAAGYGSSSRVYERSDSALGMTPAAYRKGGAGVQIAYTAAESPFGVLLIGVTERGICHVGLYDSVEAAAAGIHAEFPNAEIGRGDTVLAPMVQRILDHIEFGAAIHDLPLDIQATAFQQRVWAALREIPRGETRTYTEVAESLGQPNAVRAVAAACANNRVALVVPCHRVVGKNGSLTGYKWGVERKRRLLDAERG